MVFSRRSVPSVSLVKDPCQTRRWFHASIFITTLPPTSAHICPRHLTSAHVPSSALPIHDQHTMKSTANQHIVYLLEAERRKFDGENYTPPPRLMQRCKAACRLMKSDLSKQPRQTRQRNANAQHNLAAILEKSTDIFVLRSLTSTLTQLGSKREYGLVPILIKWWTGVQHPQSLSNISRQICTEFGLQYLDDANISKTTYQDARIPESSASDGLDLVTTGIDSNDNNLFHEAGNPDDSSREGFPTPRHPFGMTNFLDSEYGNQGIADQYHAHLSRRSENPLQVTTARSTHGMIYITSTP